MGVPLNSFLGMESGHHPHEAPEMTSESSFHTMISHSVDANQNLPGQLGPSDWHDNLKAYLQYTGAQNEINWEYCTNPKHYIPKDSVENEGK
jgi:hypothetical protein